MNNSIKKYTTIYFLYTFSFLLLLPIIFLPFFTNEKTFVWYIDGISQHYPIFQYYGDLLRNLVMGKGFPMVDFKLGLGYDTITTLHYYVLGDPISLLAIFSTPQNSIYIYEGLILLRFYLVGISFILFMKYWHKNGFSVLIGALLYVFCGYTFFAGIRHPFFLNPMIYLPLLLIGIEQVLQRKRPYFLILMVFLITISNFYFLYILTAIAVFYVVFRYLCEYRKTYKNALLGLFLTGFRIGCYYLLGLTLASFIFLPVLYAFLQNGRLNNSPTPLTGYWHYDIKYYVLLIQSIFASGVSPGFWVALSFSSVTAISFVVILCNKRFRSLRIVFLLSMAALCVPAFGYFMNGFSYITNRWSFFISFLTAVIFTLTYDYIFNLKKNELWCLTSILIGYALLSFLFPSKNLIQIECYSLLFIGIILLILQMEWFKKRRVLQESVLYSLVLITLGFHGYTYYAPEFNGYSNEFLSKDEVAQITSSGELSLIENIKDSTFYRVETSDKTVNQSLLTGFNNVSGYFSLLDANITKYMKHLELLEQKNAYRFDNLDNRTILDALNSVKYVITTNAAAAPYGYKKVSETKNDLDTYYLFKNIYALPLGYTYDSYLSEKDYKKLSSLEKQNALLYTAVLNEKITQVDKPKQDMNTGLKKLDVTITADEDIKLGKHSIIVKKPGASITLEFNSESESETYLRLQDFILKEKAATISSFKISAANHVAKNVDVRTIYNITYFGKDNYLINTGYSKKGKSQIKITFFKKESYSYDSIEVYCLTMNNYKKQVAALKQSSLQNIHLGTNSIDGEITLDHSGVLMLSVPYSKGWSAYIDGNKTRILQGNIMYMALPLDTGYHHITLRYTTPYLKEGLLISILSFVVFIGIIRMYQFANNKSYNKGE